MNFTIHLPPITKKNHQQIIRCGGRVMVIPSKQYRQYEQDCKIFMPKCDTITTPINVKALFYMPTRRKVDLTNLFEALNDIMVKYQVIEDDNSKIIVSLDGSRVLYDKKNPRTEIEITEVENE